MSQSESDSSDSWHELLGSTPSVPRSVDPCMIAVDEPSSLECRLS